MSANGTIVRVWANGEDTFALSKVDQILDLEDKCGVGIGAIYQRVAAGSYYFNDIRETVRLGLIGGGMPPDRAMVAVKRHVDPPNKLAVHVLLALDILMNAIVGVRGDDVGKKKTRARRRKAASSITPTAGLSDPQSSSLATSSDLTHEQPGR